MTSPSQRLLPHRSVHSVTKNSELIRDRREQIIQAAIRVFAAKGFHEATVRDIGGEAQLTQGKLYNYIRTKEDILFLVCDRIVTEYLDRVREALLLEGDPKARLEAAIKGILRVMWARPDSILLLYHESHNLESNSLKVILGRVDEFIICFEKLLNEAKVLHKPDEPRIRLLANIVTFLPTMVALRKWALPETLSEEEMTAEIAAFMLRGLEIAK
ncbi:MAG: TetR/AcrR family transcriptional regulator [Rhodomicrobium sp.]